MATNAANFIVKKHMEHIAAAATVAAVDAKRQILIGTCQITGDNSKCHTTKNFVGAQFI